MPWSEIVKRDGRSERALRAVVNDYLEHVQEGDAVRPLEQDPIDLLASLLNELTIMRDRMVAMAMESTNEPVVIGATREWRCVVKEIRELLQAVGKLPRELGTMRHLVEVREMAKVLDGLLDGFEAGEIRRQEVRAQLAEWAGVKVLPAGEAIEGTALTTA